MPLNLPDLTVVCIDNVAQDLARLALRDTLQAITPAAVLFWTDTVASEPDPRIHEIPFLEHGKTAADQPLWYEVHAAIQTSHFLTVQWDGWVLDASAWTDEFLEYDYIGAPWYWHPPGRQVGNGGFSLRSRQLMAYLAERRQTMPYRYPEDDLICRHYRPQLEAAGFRFAPLELAQRFSFERDPPRASFGFHGAFNLAAVLGAALGERLEAANEFVKGKTEWRELVEQIRYWPQHLPPPSAPSGRRRA